MSSDEFLTKRDEVVESMSTWLYDNSKLTETLTHDIIYNLRIIAQECDTYAVLEPTEIIFNKIK